VAEPIDQPDYAGWREWGEYIHDMLRGYPLALVVGSMVALAVSNGLRLFDATSPDTAALMNGAAAIVSALAAIISARRSGVNEQQVADHEARLRVLEDRGHRG
jgi:hypothetical protein